MAACIYADVCGSNRQDPLAVLARGRPDVFSVSVHLKCDKQCAPKFHAQRSNRALQPFEVYDAADPAFRPQVAADFFARAAAGPPQGLAHPDNCIQVDFDPSTNFEDILLWYSLPTTVQAVAPLAINGRIHIALPEWLRDSRVPRDATLLQWAVQTLDAAEVRARLEATRLDFLARVLHTATNEPGTWFGVHVVPDRDDDFVEDWVARVDPEWQARVPLLEAREGNQDVEATPAIWRRTFHGLKLSVADLFSLPSPSALDLEGPAKVFLPAHGRVWAPRSHYKPRASDGDIVSISEMCISTWPCYHVCGFASGKNYKLDGREILEQLKVQGLDSCGPIWAKHFREYESPHDGSASGCE